MKRINRLLRKCSECLVDLLRLDQPGKEKTVLHQEINALRAGGSESVREYSIRKMTMMLTVIIAGTLLSAVSFLVFMNAESVIGRQQIERPGYGEGDRQESLNVQIQGKEVQEFEVTVQERTYTDEEKQNILNRAVDELDGIVPGNNASLDEVREDLVLPELLQDGKVSASWSTRPYGVIDESGRLLGSDDENGVLVEIQGTLACGGKEMLHTMYAKVYPVIVPEQEQLHQSIQKELERTDAEESSSPVLSLPQNVSGYPLYWTRRKDNPALSILILTVLAAVCVYLEMDSRVHQRAEERRYQLLLDYPDLMWKMTMLLGAGLGIKGTFGRLAEQYQAEKKGMASAGKKKIRYVYEELTLACYEMQSGVPEAEAYERFGRRCMLPEYIRLGSMLSQNLKKGAKGLTEILEREAEASMTERKNNARKLGEKAGTKLLLPMILMLGIVLVILMVPAFLSF